MNKIISLVPIYGYHKNLPLLLEQLEIIRQNLNNFISVIVINDDIDIIKKINPIHTKSSLIYNFNYNLNVYGCINKVLNLHSNYDFIWFHDQDSYPLETAQWINYFKGEIDKNFGVLSPVKYDEYNNINRFFYMKYIKHIGLYDINGINLKNIKNSNVYGHAGNLVNTKLFPLHDQIVSAKDVGDFYYCIKSIILKYNNKILPLKYHHPNLEIKNNTGKLKNKIFLLPSNGISIQNNLLSTPYLLLYKRLKLYLPLIYVKVILRIKIFIYDRYNSSGL